MVHPKKAASEPASKKTASEPAITRADAFDDVQTAIEACRKTVSNPECMSSLQLDAFAKDLVRVIGLIAIVRHDENEVDALDEALKDLTQLKIALVFAHQALVDAGVVEAG